MPTFYYTVIPHIATISGISMSTTQEERDKLKEDFGSARKEIAALQKRIKDLGHELQSSKMESFEVSHMFRV
jgi:uncharacterized coiled-coil DUF342 family protein